MMRPTILLTLALAAFAALAGAVNAQAGQFSAAITVNGDIVTNFELEQRIRFLQVLRIPGDAREQAERGLIDDRLRKQAAKAAGITVTDDQIAAGMAEFAGRANLDTEQFLQAIGQGGVVPETFRDFVAAGLMWREYVQRTFTPKIRITEAEIDRAMSLTAQRGAGPRVLLSEIIIPTDPVNAAEKRDLATELSETIRSEAAFAEAARRYSAAPSRARGGDIGWVPLTNLPPQARQAITGLANGQVSPPVPLANAVALFRLRGVQQQAEITPARISVDYAQFLIPGGRSAAALAEAERIRGGADTCDDLYRLARGLPPERLIRETRRLSDVPADIAAELAHLDENESSLALVRGDALVLLMLCHRTATSGDAGAPLVPAAEIGTAAATGAEGEAPPIDPALGFGQGPGRDQVRLELVNLRLGQLADSALAELRANALITRP